MTGVADEDRGDYARLLLTMANTILHGEPDTESSAAPATTKVMDANDARGCLADFVTWARELVDELALRSA